MKNYECFHHLFLTQAKQAPHHRHSENLVQAWYLGNGLYLFRNCLKVSGDIVLTIWVCGRGFESNTAYSYSSTTLADKFYVRARACNCSACL